MTMHHLSLDLEPGDDALQRALGLCRQRRCTVVSLEFASGDRHRPGRLVLAVAADHDRVRLLVERLRGLVGVQRVLADEPARASRAARA